jgi:hypothetical protein
VTPPTLLRSCTCQAIKSCDGFNVLILYIENFGANIWGVLFGAIRRRRQVVHFLSRHSIASPGWWNDRSHICGAKFDA